MLVKKINRLWPANQQDDKIYKVYGLTFLRNENHTLHFLEQVNEQNTWDKSKFDGCALIEDEDFGGLGCHPLSQFEVIDPSSDPRWVMQYVKSIQYDENSVPGGDVDNDVDSYWGWIYIYPGIPENILNTFVFWGDASRRLKQYIDENFP
jgi:hypothetical protein